MASKAQLAKKVNEVVCEYCKTDWCILKEIMICKHSDSRFLVQLKCIEKFKFVLSERAGKDVGWDIAHMEWVDEGYAKRFADIYNEDLTAEQIFDKLNASSKK